MGLGLPLMSALADRVEVRARKGHPGTCVRMQFDVGAGIAVRAGAERRPAETTPAGAFTFALNGRDELPGPPEAPFVGDIVLWLEPVTLLASLAGRLLRAVGALSRFTIPGATELGAAGEAIASYARSEADGPAVCLAITATQRRLTVICGPFRREGAQEAPVGDGLSAGDVWRTLAQTVDTAVRERADHRELIRLGIVDHHRGDPAEAVPAGP